MKKISKQDMYAFLRQSDKYKAVLSMKWVQMIDDKETGVPTDMLFSTETHPALDCYAKFSLYLLTMLQHTVPTGSNYSGRLLVALRACENLYHKELTATLPQEEFSSYWCDVVTNAVMRKLYQNEFDISMLVEEVLAFTQAKELHKKLPHQKNTPLKRTKI